MHISPRFTPLIILALCLGPGACGDVEDTAPPVDAVYLDQIADVEPETLDAVDVAPPLELPAEVSEEIIEDVEVVNPCGPFEVPGEEPDTCVCAEDACYDYTTDSCVEQWLTKDWPTKSVSMKILASVHADLIAKYVDTTKMGERITDQMGDLLSIVGSPAWMALGIGYLAFADSLCALYQLGIEGYGTNLALLAEGDLATNTVPKAWMAAILMSVVTGRVDQCVMREIVDHTEEQMLEATDAFADAGFQIPADVNIVDAKAALLRYTITTEFFDEPHIPALVDGFRQALYPDNAIVMPEALTSEVIMDLILANRLGMDFDLLKFHELMGMAWTGQTFLLTDCIDMYCPIKGIHRVVLLDLMWGFVPKYYLTELAAFMLADFDEETGGYGFLEKLGLDDDILWYPSYCDIFCSAKHWHMTMCINHILWKYPEEEETIKARIAELEAQ